MRVRSSGRYAITLAALALLALAAAQAPAAQTQAQNPFCNGGGYSGDFELGVVMQTTELYTIVMHDMVTGQELGGSRRTINSATTPTNHGCHYYAYYDGVEPNFPNRVQFLPDRLYRVDMFPADPASSSVRASFYYHNGSSCTPGSDVFCPRGSASGNPDLVFFIHPEWGIRSYPVGLAPFGANYNSAEDIFGYTDATDPQGNPVPVSWVLPYDLPRLCALRPAECPSVLPDDPNYDGGFMFLSRIPFASGPSTLPITLTTAPGSEWRVPAGRSYTWSSSDVSAVRFGPGGRLNVRASATVQGAPRPGGVLHASGITFTASDAAQGWGGVSIASGGQLTLGAGSTVERVAATASRPGAVVVTAGGQVTLDGATVQLTTGAGFGGLYATGTGATLRVTGDTEVRANPSGPGIRAAAGASVTVDADGVEIYNNAEGVVASGANARALVLAGTVRNNFGPGVRASSGGRVDILRDAGGGGTSSLVLTDPVLLFQNSGGLYATPSGKQGGGVVSTGDYVCVQPPCASIGGHTFNQNTQPRPGGGPVYDAEALGGSQVIATENYWDGRTAAQVASTSNVDGKSVLLLSPTLSAPPGGASAGRSAAGGTSLLGRPAAEAARGRVSTGVQVLLAEADARVQAGDSLLAGARIVEAYGIVAGDDDREAVAEAAGRALVAVQPPALVAWAENLAASATDRPWGRRALALAHAGAGRHVEATGVAQALADEDGAGADSASVAHRARGLGLVVAFAVASGDEAGALAALSSLAGVDSEGAADAAVQVAVAFPDADVTLVRQASNGRGTSPVGGESANLTVAAEAGVALSVGPNPSADRAEVALTLPSASVVSVAVFDALGRQVATLHDGASPGETLTVSLDASTLPPGVYVIRAVVRTADGSSSVLARRLVVAR